MESTIIYSTENNNSYLYSVEHSFSMLIHPELVKAHKKAKDVDSYYLKKYNYLKENDFFGETKPVEFGNVLKEDVIKKNIAQLPEVVFETTDHCNLNCRYCSLGELYTFSKKERRNANIQYAINLLKYIFSLKPKGSELALGFFGGEPLVNAYFIKTVIDEAKRLNLDKKLKLEFLMTTNATLIDKYIHILVENNFNLLISLDGDKKAQSYRVFAKDSENSFCQVINNIDMIQEKYPEYFKKNVEFNAVLHDQNSVKDIYEFIYSKYKKIPGIAQLNIDHVNPDKKDVFDKMYQSRRKSEDEFHKEKSKLSLIMHEYSISFKELSAFLTDYSINFYMTNILDLLYDKVNPVPTKTCSPFQRKMYFNTYNMLLPCEKVSYRYFMGKANNEIVIDIPHLVQQFNFYYKEFGKICQHCYNRRTCSICMLTLDNLDKLGTDEFECMNFMNINDFKNKLYRIFSFFEINRKDFWKIMNDKTTE